MKWIRSWPQWWDSPDGPPEHLVDRPYVIDTMERRYMSGWDYNTFDFPDEAFILVEWDIAIDRPGREAFEKFALQVPHRVATAPYHLGDGRKLDKGFGCVYLPMWVVSGFKQTNPELFSDSTFFKWYGRPRVCSYVHPQHLNS